MNCFDMIEQYQHDKILSRRVWLCANFWKYLTNLTKIQISNFLQLFISLLGGSSLDAFMTEDQKKYIAAMKKASTKKPMKALPRPYWRPQAIIFGVITNKKFDMIIMAFIGVNMVNNNSKYMSSPDDFTKNESGFVSNTLSNQVCYWFFSQNNVIGKNFVEVQTFPLFHNTLIFFENENAL